MLSFGEDFTQSQQLEETKIPDTPKLDRRSIRLPANNGENEDESALYTIVQLKQMAFIWDSAPAVVREECQSFTTTEFKTALSDFDSHAKLFFHTSAVEFFRTFLDRASEEIETASIEGLSAAFHKALIYASVKHRINPKVDGNEK